MVQQTPCSCPAVTLFSMGLTEMMQPKAKMSFQRWSLTESLDLCVLHLSLHSWKEALLAPPGVLFLQSQSSVRRYTRATRTRKTRPIRKRFWEVWSQATRSGIRRTVFTNRHIWTLHYPIFLFWVIFLFTLFPLEPGSPVACLPFWNPVFVVNK